MKGEKEFKFWLEVLIVLYAMCGVLTAWSFLVLFALGVISLSLSLAFLITLTTLFILEYKKK